MWVLTGERERFCGIHICGKVNQNRRRGRWPGPRLFEPVDSPPVVIGVNGTAIITWAAYCWMIQKLAYASARVAMELRTSPCGDGNRG
jgi:hypothetical protein